MTLFGAGDNIICFCIAAWVAAAILNNMIVMVCKNRLSPYQEATGKAPDNKNFFTFSVLGHCVAGARK